MKFKQKSKLFCQKHKRKLGVVILFMAMVLFAAFDVRLKVVTYSIQSEKINEPVKIALITDLHGCDYGQGQKTLVDAIDAQNPDVILLGGDIFDDVMPYTHSEVLLEEIAHRYPCYYVTGNHEYWSGDIDTILDIISSYGVHILDGSTEVIEVRGEQIQLSGISDPDAMFYVENQMSYQTQLDDMEEAISSEYFSVLLAHRPEWIETYLGHSYDLVLSGHAHGGQWRIPFLLNGVYAPDQGFRPAYAGGHYAFEQMDFIVSRGLARESTEYIPRIFNRPELVIVEVRNEKNIVKS